MKDTRKRMALTLSPEAHAALDRFSAVSGVAASSYVSSLIDDALPLITAMTRALQVAKRQPQAAADILNETMASVVANATKAQADMNQSLQDRKRRRRSPKPR